MRLFPRFFIALLMLIFLCIGLFRFIPERFALISILAILFIVVPLVSYTWATLTTSWNNDTMRANSPFLYAAGMIFGIPNAILGLICFLSGIGWIISYLFDGIRLSAPTVVFSFMLVIFGLSWLMNAGIKKLAQKRTHTLN